MRNKRLSSRGKLSHVVESGDVPVSSAAVKPRVADGDRDFLLATRTRGVEVFPAGMLSGVYSLHEPTCFSADHPLVNDDCSAIEPLPLRG